MRFLRILLNSVLISLSCSYIIMSLMIYNSPNEVMSGQELLKQVLIAALLGVAISITSLIFEFEKIPFFGQLSMHFFSILACVFTAGYLGHWYYSNEYSKILIILISTVVIYGFTWWFMQNLTKKDIEQLNRTIKKRRGEK